MYMTVMVIASNGAQSTRPHGRSGLFLSPGWGVCRNGLFYAMVLAHFPCHKKARKAFSCFGIPFCSITLTSLARLAPRLVARMFKTKGILLRKDRNRSPGYQPHAVFSALHLETQSASPELEGKLEPRPPFWQKRSDPHAIRAQLQARKAVDHGHVATAHVGGMDAVLAVAMRIEQVGLHAVAKIGACLPAQTQAAGNSRLRILIMRKPPLLTQLTISLRQCEPATYLYKDRCFPIVPHEYRFVRFVLFQSEGSYLHS